MKVTIDLDPADVWRYQERAELQGVRAGDVLRAEIALRRPTRDLPDAVYGRVKAGWSDSAIARELNETNACIATIRRRLNLPPNHDGNRGGGGRRRPQNELVDRDAA